ncbi:MAG: hypothetical protein HYR55_07010 [Acidobacteria bacterium]|nr:hypothetical protein [Acidobacteriota bacterium]MBI3656228.1 hypothetical protein [Acidobacteriota bacterium]
MLVDVFRKTVKAFFQELFPNLSDACTFIKQQFLIVERSSHSRAFRKEMTMRRNTFRGTFLVLGTLVVACSTIISKLEPLYAGASTRPSGYTILKRSLVAFKKDGNGVHLSWRLFQEDLDAQFRGFKVFRQSADITSNCQNLKGYVTTTTACDDQPGAGTFTYYVQAFDINGILMDTSNSVTITTSLTEQNYLALNLGGQVINNPSVTLNGKYKTGNGKRPSVTVGDLEGNGAMGFVVTFEPQTSDQGAGRYYIQAFKSNGQALWTGPRDIGPAAPDMDQPGAPLVTGIGWHNPVLIWDIQGGPGGTPDGFAEIIVRTSTDTSWNDYLNENLTVINGQSGSVISQVTFPPGAAPGGYVSEREGNQLAVAYLDGMSNPSTATPYVFISRGMHMDTHTYIYKWNSTAGNLASVSDRYLCGTPGTAHNIAIGDTDLGCTGGAGCDNNNDKIIFRETCLSGTTLANCPNWTNVQIVCTPQRNATTRQLNVTQLGYYSMHSHTAILADIDPNRAGLELLFSTHRVGAESSSPYAALYLTDAQTGDTTLWSKSSESYPGVSCPFSPCPCNDGSLACSALYAFPGQFLSSPSGLQISAQDAYGSTDTTYLWSATGGLSCPNPGTIGVELSNPLNWDSSGISYWYTTRPPDNGSPGVFKLANCTTNTRVATFGTCNNLDWCVLWTADIFGDAAEEVVVAPGGTNPSVQIFTNTTSPSGLPRPRKRTSLQDRKYRLDLTRTVSADGWSINESGQTISAKQ